MKEYRTEKPNNKLRTNEMEFFKMRTVNSYAEAAHTHVHDAIELIYMNKGSVQVSINGEKSKMYPGDLALFHSRAIHDIWTEDQLENNYYVLKILPRILYGLVPSEKESDFILRFLISKPTLKMIWRKEEIEGTDIELGLRRLIDSLDAKKRVSDISKIISTLLVLDGVYKYDNSFIKDVSLSDERLYYAIFYINEHFTEPITAEKIAVMTNMSISSFSRSFKRATGQSFRDYLNTVRTNMAKELLITTDLSVSECAVRSGYNNISHFISIYKRYKGKTPLEERKT